MNSSLRSISLKDFVLWILRRYRRFRVTGNSMLPLLFPGQEVLINPTAYTQVSPVPGDIVVAVHPQQPDLRIIKRVEFVEPDGRCYLKGENTQESSDSRQFGLIARAQLQGKVVCSFP
ncbi:MAG: nickel-type superoxide dismutase maturation protease [Leptolyngbya sp. SIO1D8]|nr:nickel-type superoxide dismutase maturation protease [Leptolyngbya sp. SIO1D8]